MKLADLVPDPRNANRGTERGQGMLEASLRKYGAGRSILLDKHRRIIAGNKTVENAGQIGMEDLLVVENGAGSGMGGTQPDGRGEIAQADVRG